MTLDWTGPDDGGIWPDPDGLFGPASSPQTMIVTGQAPAGWLLTLFFGDGTGTAGILLTGVTDSVGNTYVIDSAVNRPDDGANAYLVHSKLTHDLGLGPAPFDTITFTWTGGDWSLGVLGFAFNVTNGDGVGGGVAGLGPGSGAGDIAVPGVIRTRPVAAGGTHRQPVWPRKPSLEGDQIMGGAHASQVRVVGNDGLLGSGSSGNGISVGADAIDGDLAVAFAVYRDGPTFANDPDPAWEEDFAGGDPNQALLVSPDLVLMAAQVSTSSERLTYNTSSSGVNDQGASVIGIYR